MREYLSHLEPKIMDRGIFNIGSFISIEALGKTDYKLDQHGII